MNFRLRKLDDEHYVEFFETETVQGKGSELGDWLSGQAREYQAKGRAAVWILGSADDPADVAGYFTLSAYQLSGDSLSRKLREGINSEQFHPAHLLGKFALSSEMQGQGLGRRLMVEVFRIYHAAAELSGSRFLCLHVRDPKLEKYYHESFKFITIRQAPPGQLTLMVVSTDAVADFLEQAGILTEKDNSFDIE